MDVITLEHAQKAYGSTPVLKDVNLTIREHEFLVVVGPSGCGKSTLLRLIAGLEKLSGGHIRFSGQVADNWEPYDRNVGMVFQNYALYPHMTVYDNLAFGLQAHKEDKTEIRRRVTEVASLLELKEVLRSRPGALSGGQRQRVALGRALVRDPRVFLMDEPLSNLDAMLRERMRVELRALYERVGIPTVYVTHDQTEAMTMADRIVVMRDGDILQVGVPEDVYHRPENTFVAQFFGSPPMNIVPMELLREKGQYVIHADGDKAHAVVLPPSMVGPMMQAATDDGQFAIGFRAEGLLSQAGSASGLTFPFRALTTEALGARYNFHGEWGPHRISIVSETAIGFDRHEIVPFVVPWDRVHWFSGADGRRIDDASADRCVEGGAV